MSLLQRLRSAAQPALDALDPDVALQLAVGASIERARSTWPRQPWQRWRPGEPLRLLLVGYNGTRNTGADVRVQEMVRQLHHVLGDQLALRILVQDPALTEGYFPGTHQLTLPQVFPAFLYEQVRDVHGVVACEGSMFKSRFANALSTLMAGALGLASAGDKLSMAYGGEAGRMDPGLERFVRRYAADAWVVVRNPESQGVLKRLGIPSKIGTDTAWSFEPAPPEDGAALLRSVGWDGTSPILTLCPIHPFWWPVRPDPARWAAHATLGLHAPEHYAGPYFHKGGPEVQHKLDAYLDALAAAAQPFAARHNAFVLCLGMERLDRGPCEALAQRLGGAAVLSSGEHEMFSLVSALRHSRWLVSSRYHALVTSMPGGVVSAGVTMDERIRNLMADRGTPELALEVDDPQLASKLTVALNRLHADAPALRQGIEATVAKNLLRFGEMGRWLARHVQGQLPDFPLPDFAGTGSAEAHLPPLSPALRDLLARHAPGAAP